MKKLKCLVSFALCILLIFTFSSCISGTDTSSEASLTDPVTSDTSSDTSQADEEFLDAEFKYTVDRTLSRVAATDDSVLSGSVEGKLTDEGISITAGKNDIVAELKSTCSGLCDFTIKLAGSELPQSVRLVISTDKLDWYLVGDIDGTVTDGVADYTLALESGVRARYLRIIFNAPAAATLSTFEACLYENMIKMYVNAIDGELIYSVIREGDTANMFGEGQGAIVTESYTNFPQQLVWNKVVCCTPTSTEGKYEVSAIYKEVGDGKSKLEVKVPEGGFCYVVNLGNDYPAIYETTGNAAYAGFPNYTTDEINNSFSVVDTLDISDTVTLFNIDLETPYIAESFGSYLCVLK
ncbi:MAG TPA: hypothetical protein PLT66_02175 [Bacillota bacterium]|nr:hypothetical protein [Bacillota bacterium]